MSVIKRIVSYGSLVVLLLISSAVIFALQIVVFHRTEDTFFYLFQDLAFVSLQAVIVTLFLNKAVSAIQKQQNSKKVNVIISAFFSELGLSVVSIFAKLTENIDELGMLSDVQNCNKKKINELKQRINGFDFKMSLSPEKLEKLGLVLIEKKSFMIGMLENSSLMEHDTFTDMLWSLFHVADELQSRDLLTVSKADMQHLNNDVLRAYRAILAEWIAYINYLKIDYPYLYNTAISKSPFKQMAVT